jgi:CubicO group peptidase (beta-lactamase class C family)
MGCRYTNISITLSILGILYAGACLAQPGELKTEIEKIITYDTEIDFRKTPGFIISVLDGDSVSYFAFGVKEKQTNNLPKKDDLYEIGGLTQIITAFLVSKVEEGGYLDWHDSVNLFIPENYRNPRLDSLTICHLVNHQTTFPERPPNLEFSNGELRSPYQFYADEQLLTFYRDFLNSSVKNSPSFINYGLLEIILTRATHKTYEDLVKLYITEPWQLQNTFTDFGEQREKIMTPGYTHQSTLAEPWQFASFKASEGIKTSISDLAYIVKQVMKSISRFTCAGTRRGAVEMQHRGQSVNSQSWMGWNVTQIEKNTVLIQSGVTSGYSSFACMVPETGSAVIVLSNSVYGTRDLGLQILRMINNNWKRPTQFPRNY